MGISREGNTRTAPQSQRDRDQHDAASLGAAEDDPILHPEPKQWDSPGQPQFYPSATF